ncbi:PAS domain S-box protein [Agrobacterium vitis]|uniref:histidine kinase n=1 Tax=Agrobacterium vitis TaxID=373 RepID=A0ABD6GKE3_AGRVI|nr:ATP-binding protein [Agrobacterium vitis]MUO82311.1 PAS domain S-box protein [Agrobacterium vitis]MUO97534.1 PAS domain S-box protein [Agrobacterium vitis]MUP08054.1 PAS domain S-box protein [Agrobacterium vitis]MUZ85230.1 PAS domain S-box protein [Agrobacterium vitis]MVA12684.1 PAS domain S-box protein [Agrobacterium vitis]
MPAIQYPFIDIAVHSAVRAKFARGDALALFSPDLERVLWANGAGAGFFGTASVYDFLDQGPPRQDVTFRQIAAMARQLKTTGEARRLVVRAGSGFRLVPVEAQLERLEIRPGEVVILFSMPVSYRDASARSEALLRGFEDPDTHMALLDSKGAVIRASGNFDRLGITPRTIETIVQMAQVQPGGLMKRPIPTARGNLPAALGKIADDPAMFLLFAVETLLGTLDASDGFTEEQPIPASVTSPQVHEPQVSIEPAVAAVETHLSEPPPSETFPAADTIAVEVEEGKPEEAKPEETRSTETFEDVVEALGSIHELEPEPEDLSQADAMSPQPDDHAEDKPLPEDEPAPEELSVPEESPAEAEQPATSDAALTEDSQASTDLPDSDLHADAEQDEIEAEDDARLEETAEPEAFTDPADQPDESEAETEASSADAFEQDEERETEPASYSAEETPELPETVSEQAARQEETTQQDFAFTPTMRAARFVWKVDALGCFSEVSPEFAKAVGPRSAAIEGQTFADLAALFNLDPDGKIVELLKKRDTWSGKTIYWPIEGTSLKVPVDLAALPTYTRNRDFDGFRGFGVVRLADCIEDIDKVGLTLSAPLDQASKAEQVAQADPQQDMRNDVAAPAEVENADTIPVPERVEEQVAERQEVPALIISAPAPLPQAENIVQLKPRNFGREGLSPAEHATFQEIARRLDALGAKSADGSHDLSPKKRRDDKPALEDQKPSAVDAADAEKRKPDADAAGVTPEATDTTVPSPRAERDSLPENDNTKPDPATDLSESQASEEVDDEVIDESTSAEDGDEPADVVSDQEEDFSAETVVEFLAPSAGDEVSANTNDVAEDGKSAADEMILPVASVPGALLPRPPRDVVFSPDVLDMLPVALLAHRGDTLIHANPEFLALTGYADLGALAQAGGLDVLLQRDDVVQGDNPQDDQPGTDDARRDGRLVVVRADDALVPVSARLQSIRWEEASALLLALVPQAPAKPAETPVADHTPLPVSDAGDGSQPGLDHPTRLDAVEHTGLRIEVEELRSILETATDGVVTISTDGEIRSVNGAASALFNYDEEDIRGKPFVTLFAHESQRAILDYLGGLTGHGVASVLNDGREVIGRESSGGFIPLFMTIGRLSSSNGFCAVIRDITQWKRTEEELRSAKRAAETANAHKTDFLARVSHEIRTPLNAIIGFADIMADERFGPIGHGRYAEYAADIGRSGRHVLDIVNDLLDISKIEAGEMDLDFIAVGLNETVSEAVAIVQPQANGQRVIIRTALSQSVPNVVADMRSIKQIVLNILSNAIRFTPSGGQIIVSTNYEPNGSVTLRIRDTGIGMTRAELEQAMKPFRQVSPGGARLRGDGTGLGLPLTKAMVDANRASFAIQSTPNEGTLVEITFPSPRVLAG